MKLGKLFRKWRVILLILFLLISLLAINPQFDNKGVIVKAVEQNSSALFAGLQNPGKNTPLMSYERIIAINNNKVDNLNDYSNELSKIELNSTIRIKTNKQEYIFLKDIPDLGITVDKAPTSNLKKGLELQGGSRVLLKPAEKISDSERDDVISVMENRLNTYGLTDIKIKKADDLLGNKYISVEIAGASKQEVRDLIGSQGKFEAKIGDQVIFEGGKKDITFVCRNDGTCSGVRQCDPVSDGYACEFEFSIALSAEAAKRHAEITNELDINISEGGRQYLSKTLDLYLDDKQVDTLQISADLKGKEATQIAISGPGVGPSQQEAIQNAIKQMNKLQTVLITGSLPTKLEMVKVDSISPVLGAEFMKNVLTIGLLAIAAIAIVIFIRYRNPKVSIPMVIIQLSEITLTLGFAALFKYNLDLAAIAGIIAAIGTGVNDQIIISDEILSKSEEGFGYKWKQKIKRAFFIIMAAYAVGVASLLPLLKAGAGLLIGFAVMTIVGISIGVFITRPAFGAMLEVLFEE